MATTPTPQAAPAPPARWPVFLCYRQSDGRETADWLYDNLHDQPITENGQVLAALEVYQDRKAPAASDWHAIHLPAMQRARCFIIIVTPGLYAGLGRNDWVQQELHWWLSNRRTAPVIIDATGEGERWIPEKVKKRWPNAQRIEIRLTEWSKLGAEEVAARENIELARIREGIRLNERKINHEDLVRFKRLVLRLRTALVIAMALAIAAVVFAIWGNEARKAANAQAKIARSRELAALSTVERDHRLDRALLLAVKAVQVQATNEARNALMKALLARPGLSSFLHLSEGSVRCVAFSIDGKILATGCQGRVVLWDVAARKRLTDSPLPVNEGRVWSLAFSPDGKTLAAGYSSDSREGVVFWDTSTHQRRTGEPLSVKEGELGNVVFSPNSKILAAGCGLEHRDGGAVILWDVASGQRLSKEPFFIAEGAIGSVAFGPDGKTLAAGCDLDAGAAVVLWDVASGQRLSKGLLAVKEGDISSVAFSPDGKILAAGYYQGNARSGGVVLWDSSTRIRLPEQPLPVKEGRVKGIAFSADGRTLAAECYRGIEGGVVLWEVENRTRLSEEPLPIKEGRAEGIAFSPKDKILAAGYQSAEPADGGVIMWNLKARKGGLTDEPLTVDDPFVWTVAFGQDRETLVIGCFDGRGGVRVVRRTLGAWQSSAEQALPIKIGKAESVAFSRDGQILAAARAVDRGSRVELWDTATGKPLAMDLPPVNEGNVSTLVFAPDGKTLAGAYNVKDQLGGIIVWDVAGGDSLMKEPVSCRISSLAFSQNSQILAAGCCPEDPRGGGVLLWNLTTRKRLSADPLPVKEGEVQAIAFRPDGQLLAAGYGVKTERRGGVVLCDVTTRQRIIPDSLPVKEGTVGSLAFSPDGRTLAAKLALGRSGVVLWDMETRERIIDDPLPIKEGRVSSIAFSPDGHTLAAGYFSLNSTVIRGAGVTLIGADLESWIRRAGIIANRNFTGEEWRQYFPGELYRATFPDLPIPPEVPAKDAPPTQPNADKK